MLKLKGRYDWQLINKDTGRVDREGSQWNTINDSMLIPILQLVPGVTVDSSFIILLSDTTPAAGSDYRRYGTSSYFNILTSGVTTQVRDSTLNFIRSEHNFPPPVGSPRTIRLIGLSAYVWLVATYNWASYIQLSTPITQNTNQYLYVKYTLYLSYASNANDLNSASNRYVDYYINKGLLVKSSSWSMTTLNVLIGRYYESDPTYTWRYFHVTPFIEPEDKNNLARSVSIITNCIPSETTNYGSVFAVNYNYDFATKIGRAHV